MLNSMRTIPRGPDCTMARRQESLFAGLRWSRIFLQSLMGRRPKLIPSPQRFGKSSGTKRCGGIMRSSIGWMRMLFRLPNKTPPSLERASRRAKARGIGPRRRCTPVHTHRILSSSLLTWLKRSTSRGTNSAISSEKKIARSATMKLPQLGADRRLELEPSSAPTTTPALLFRILQQHPGQPRPHRLLPKAAKARVAEGLAFEFSWPRPAHNAPACRLLG